MRKRTVLILSLLLPIQFFFLQILKKYPRFVEEVYSLGIYPVLSKNARFLFGKIPFSVGDFFYLLIAVLAIRWLINNAYRLRFEPLRFFLEITAAVSVVYCMFHMLWGFNYYRLPLHESLNLESDYSYEQLVATTRLFIEKSNAKHLELGYPDSVKIDLPYSQKEIFDKTSNGYENLKLIFPKLEYSPKSIKTSNWSLGLTYMGYSGYLNPFSGEAQVNGLLKSYKFPVVACHEEAHQIGYAAENEANFIAAMATLHNEDSYIQYAGLIYTLRYLINDVARNNQDQYYELLETIHPGILESYREMREFWDQYENPFENFSKIFWDLFLKANNQKKGIRSYDYMVALTINYFDENPL